MMPKNKSNVSPLDGHMKDTEHCGVIGERRFFVTTDNRAELLDTADHKGRKN